MQPSGDGGRPSRAALRALLGGVSAGALAIAALTACTAASSTGDSAANGTSASDAATVSASPGKYRVLPEPCGAVSTSTLKSLVPEAEDYAGQADLTYDTDRQVGCEWTGRTDRGNRYLHVGFLRVVSYDATVSDETQAEEDYDEKAVAAGIEPAVVASASASDSASAGPAGSSSPSASAAVSPSGSAALATRALSDLGDTAYIDDVLKTRDSGVHRDITVVFRKSNVLVTVEYSQWSTDSSVIPSSQELQDAARTVAAELAHQLDE